MRELERQQQNVNRKNFYSKTYSKLFCLFDSDSQADQQIDRRRYALVDKNSGVYGTSSSSNLARSHSGSSSRRCLDTGDGQQDGKDLRVEESFLL
uniref:Uncharacterized protein n=1 Tax=Romanomermis culicivorax TaxID=13658 RepID=A0A915L1X9_ROMCU